MIKEKSIIGSLPKNGLTNAEVIERRKRFGSNKLPKKIGRGPLVIFLSQFENPLIYIISIAALISLVLEEFGDALIIGAVILLNTIVGFFQEYRAEKTMAALRQLLKPTAKVIREGNVVEVETTEIVPGDLIVLNSGDKIPADGELIESINFSTNEAILTGESESVIKDINATVFMGTSVLAGRGLMKVTYIGRNTELGKIATSLAEIQDEITPLQIRLQDFGKTLTYFVVIICLIIFSTGVLLTFNFIDMIRMSVILAIAAIPEGLIIAVTMILAIGMHRILQRKGLVKKLLAVETLGSVTTICTDKTGTLTEGTMQVVRTDFRSEKMAMHIMALCNNLEDSLEIQLWKHVEIMKMNPQDLSNACRRVDEIPFSSENKYMMTTNVINGTEVVLVKGAPDIVMEFCDLNPDEKQKLTVQFEEWAGLGLKLLGLAYKQEGRPRDVRGYIWVGLIGIEDPVRPSVKDAIILCRRAGIKVKIITGDYQKTAIKVAANLGLVVGSERILEGSEIETMDESELMEIVDDIVIFCRVTPHHKLRIVTALQKCGEQVAMIGDGVNDAPALKKANIGVSVGVATDVAQETASLILLDNNFKTLVDSVEEGRVIFDNIKKVVVFVLSNSFAEISIIFIAFVLGWPVPLTIAQILWIHLICDGPSDIALGFEPGEKGIMDEPPRSVKENILDNKGKFLIIAISSLSALFCLLLFGYFTNIVGNEKLARTLVFTILAIQSLVYIFSFRSLRRSIFKSGNFFSNKPLIFSVVLGIGQVFVALYIPFFNDILDVIPLDFTSWIIVLSVSLIMVAIVEIVKFVDRRLFRPTPLQNIFTNIERVQQKLPKIHNLHNISIDIMEDKTLIQFHFDIPAETTLEIAHEVAKSIEEKIADEFPLSLRKNLEIISHIEPAQLQPGRIHSHPTPIISPTIQDIIQTTINKFPQIKGWDRGTVLQDEGNISISMTVYLEGTMNISQVHNVSEEIETELRKNIPSLKRCNIHSEPFLS